MISVDDLTLTDYTVAVGKIVKPENILYASKVSKNRVCLYLTSKNLVDDLTNKLEFILIKEKTVYIRPLE